VNEKLHDILGRIKLLEAEVAREIESKEKEFFYTLRGRTVRFDAAVARRNRGLAKSLLRYLVDSGVLGLLAAPFIWLCLAPAVFLDLTVSLTQAVCFPIYGIPKVRRGEYLVFDRRKLGYLNAIEKINCEYCAYFNGLMAYAREAAARTEQYWCPIKHTRIPGAMHSRYARFFDFGDGAAYRARLDEVRKDYRDLETPDAAAPGAVTPAA
jgi:hypothetical protein